MKKKMLPDVRHKKKCSKKVFDIKLISGWNCKIQSPQESKEALNHEKDHFHFGCSSNAAFTRSLRQHGHGIGGTLTGNCTITSLTNNGKINFNGYTITLADGTVLK